MEEEKDQNHEIGELEANAPLSANGHNCSEEETLDEIEREIEELASDPSALPLFEGHGVLDALYGTLGMICNDIQCYGECYKPIGGEMVYFRSHLPKNYIISTSLEEFIAGAPTERYTDDVGLVGMSMTSRKIQFWDINTVLQDQYFSNCGERLVKAANLFQSAITIPFERRHWNPDERRVNLSLSALSSATLGTCMNLHPGDILGVIVLYFPKPPKLKSLIASYLSTVALTFTPLAELMSKRSTFARLTRKGGQKRTRLRKVLISKLKAMHKSIRQSRGSTTHKAVAEDRSSDTDVVLSPKGGPQSMDIESGDHNVDISSASYTRVNYNTFEEYNKQFFSEMARIYVIVQQYFQKYLGGKVNLPPRIDINFSWAAFLCCWITMAGWQKIADSVNNNFEFHGVVNPMVIPGSFGALCTIIFALPAAPLAQPRIVLLAHTYTMLVATIISYSFNQFEYVWLQKALVAGFAISGMAKFGILNPPAGAVAMILVTYRNSSDFSDYGYLFQIVSAYFGCVWLIVVGVVIHNFYFGRMYPLFW